MRIALAQLNYHIGNFEQNTYKIISHIKKAKEAGADLVVFSELCVCGYPPKDFLEFPDFIEKCYAAVEEIASHADTIGVIVGAPSRNPDHKGKSLYNSAFFLYDKQVKQAFHKTLLPVYDVFDEGRYFESNNHWQVLEFQGQRIAITICEDIWNTGDNPLYRITPMDELVKHKPDLIINLSASPFSYTQPEIREHVIREVCTKYHLPMYYCNTVGAQTDIVFEGGSMVMNAGGMVVDELKYFEEDFKIYDTTHLPVVSKDNEQPRSKTHLIYQALVLGIKDYFNKMGFTKAILGLSGGIDSAVVACVAVKALGQENVHVLLLPSQYSTAHSVSDAELLAANLGISLNIIPIGDSYTVLHNALAVPFKDTIFNIAEENLQARVRGVLLMAMSNKFGYILLNTTNKSEMAVGYGTLYGDMCGGLSIIGDVYKTEVYDLANYINQVKELIPQNIITKAPSAELRPDQKDSDSLPEYDILDKILYQYIEHRQGPRELIEMGFDKALVDRVLKLVNTNEYKRHQTAPVIRVSPKAFGSGRRMPIVGKYLG